MQSFMKVYTTRNYEYSRCVLMGMAWVIGAKCYEKGYTKIRNEAK